MQVQHLVQNNFPATISDHETSRESGQSQELVLMDTVTGLVVACLA